MGVLLTADDYAAEPYATKYNNPVQEGLEISGLFNTDLTKVGRNFAPGKKNFIVRGAPTLVNAGGGTVNAVRLTGLSNFLDTYWPDTAAATIMLVCSTPDGAQTGNNLPAFLGTAVSRPKTQNIATTTFGTRFYISSSGAVRLTVGHGTDVASDIQSSLAISVADHATMALYTLEWPGDAGLDKITSISSGLSSEWAGTAQARFLTINRMRIGSLFQSNVGRSDHMLIRGWSRALTTDEKDDETADINDYCTALGVPLF